MTTTEDILAHHGVKGMKWGVRKARKQEHKAWLKEAKSGDTATKVFQEAVRTFNPVLAKINADPAFAGKDLNSDRRLRRDYDAVVSTIFNQHLQQASFNNTLNSAGDRAVVYQMTADGLHMRATEVKRVGA